MINLVKFLVVFIVWTSSVFSAVETVASPPSVGNGSSGSPYQIATLANLRWLSETTTEWATGKYFVQTGDIDAADTSIWNDLGSGAEGFSPIGNLSARFYGNYDGQGHKISNLYINRASGLQQGLFGWVQTGTIQRMILEDANITVNTSQFYGVGIAIGGGYNGNITDINISGGTLTVSGSYPYMGSLVGRYSTGSISNSTSNANVIYNGIGTGYPVGGLIGHIDASSGSYNVTNSSFTGNVTVSTNSRTGGFAGELSGVGTVSKCFSSGTVTNTNGGYVGGFVGNPYETVIEDSYTVSSISVTSTSSVGGFFSSSPTASFNKPIFRRCYSAATITGGSAGGFGGQSNYTNDYIDCFWDVNTTNNTVGVSNGKSGNLVAKTTAEMKLLSAFTDANWDFSNETTNGTVDIWDMDNTNGVVNSGYPYLAWEGPTLVVIPSAPVITSTQSDVTIAPGDSFSYFPTATDIDGDSLTWSLTDGTSLSGWLTFETNSSLATFVGSDTQAEGYADGNTTDALFNNPYHAEFDSQGNLFVVDEYNHRIRKVTPEGMVTTFAGSGAFYPTNTPPTDGVGTAAIFSYPKGIAIDSNDNLFVSDGDRNIRKITPDGTVTTYNSNSFGREGLVLDSQGNLFVAGSNYGVIYKIEPNGNRTIFAGGYGQSGYVDGISTTARFNQPRGLAIDVDDNLYLADASNNRIRKITPSGDVTTFAGDGTYASTDGNLMTASFGRPFDLEFDGQGNLYVMDQGTGKVRKISVDGNVTTLKDSTGTAYNTGWGRGIAIDTNDNLFITTYDMFDNVKIIEFTTSVYGTSSLADVGTHDVNLTVTDGEHNVTQNFTITIGSANIFPPVIVSTQEDVTIVPGDDFSYELNATDEDGDTLIWGLTPGTELNASCFTLSSTIPYTIEGTGSVECIGTHDVNLTVTDGEHNATQNFTITIAADTDGDSIPDINDIDDDNDGIPDLVEEVGDTARDTDGDGIVDSKDLDSDNDGILDIVEAGGTDADDDGMVDDTTDTDNDGLADVVDVNPSTFDNLATMNEAVTVTTLPLTDTDGDGTRDAQDVDSDNDGISDLVEGGIDPLLDADNNGTIDIGGGIDDTGIATGLAPSTTPDTDTDGISDYRDLDSDNDGLTDVVESGGSDTDGNGLVDIAGTLVVVPTLPDGNSNNIPDTLEANNPNLPVSLDNDPADGVIDDNNDTDGDGIPDVADATNGFGSAIGLLATSNDVNITEYGGTVIDVLGNGDTFVVLSDINYTQPANGTVSIDDNGTPDDPTDDVLIYAPDADFNNATDSFTYTITDSAGNTSTATVLLNVVCGSSQTSDSGDALSVSSMLIMMFLTGTAGLYFIRREEERGEA